MTAPILGMVMALALPPGTVGVRVDRGPPGRVAASGFTLLASVVGSGTATRYRASVTVNGGTLDGTVIAPDGRTCQTEFSPDQRPPHNGKPWPARVTFAFRDARSGSLRISKRVDLWCYSSEAASVGITPLPEGKRQPIGLSSLWVTGPLVEIGRFGQIVLWTDRPRTRSRFAMGELIYVENRGSPQAAPEFRRWSATQGTLEELDPDTDNRHMLRLLFQPWRSGRQMAEGLASVALTVRSAQDGSEAVAAFAFRVFRDGSYEIVRLSRAEVRGR